MIYRSRSGNDWFDHTHGSSAGLRYGAVCLRGVISRSPRCLAVWHTLSRTPPPRRIVRSAPASHGSKPDPDQLSPHRSSRTHGRYRDVWQLRPLTGRSRTQSSRADVTDDRRGCGMSRSARPVTAASRVTSTPTHRRPRTGLAGVRSSTVTCASGRASVTAVQTPNGDPPTITTHRSRWSPLAWR
jgi:hypothetical protein